MLKRDGVVRAWECAAAFQPRFINVGFVAIHAFLSFGLTHFAIDRRQFLHLSPLLLALATVPIKPHEVHE